MVEVYGRMVIIALRHSTDISCYRYPSASSSFIWFRGWYGYDSNFFLQEGAVELFSSSHEWVFIVGTLRLLNDLLNDFGVAAKTSGDVLVSWSNSFATLTAKAAIGISFELVLSFCFLNEPLRSYIRGSLNYSISIVNIIPVIYEYIDLILFTFYIFKKLTMVLLRQVCLILYFGCQLLHHQSRFDFRIQCLRTPLTWC